AGGRVTMCGHPATKPSAAVADDAALAVDEGDDWASRGAHKLLGALDRFRIDVAGRRVVDAGASHGGFTDVLLRRGASAVVALDVGPAQLRPRLAADPRVHVADGTNVRRLTRQRRDLIARGIGGPPDLVVVDLSFVSLTLALPPLLDWPRSPSAAVLPMV